MSSSGIDDRGEGEAVVLVHGFPLDRTLWQGQDPLTRQLRLVRFDLPGFGTEAATESWTASMETYSSAVLAAMDSAGLERATLCGLSMGGYVLFDLWRRAPGRIARLVLCDTRAEPDSAEARRGRQQGITTVRDGRRQELTDSMLDKLLCPASLAQPALVDPVRAMMARASDAGICAALHAMQHRPDSTPDLPGITVPTLVVVGSEDKLTPPEDARRMQASIPGSRMVELNGAAHLSPFENPDAFNNALLGFIEGSR